jgi:uncharacterized protein YggE
MVFQVRLQIDVAQDDVRAEVKGLQHDGNGGTDFTDPQQGHSHLALTPFQRVHLSGYPAASGVNLQAIRRPVNQTAKESLMKPKPLLILAFAGALQAFCIGAVLAAESPGPATIEVQGAATVMVAPDMARITFTVETGGAQAKEAVARNAEETRSLLGALRPLMEGGDSIKTANYALTPVYGKAERLRPEGYRVRNTVSVETRRLESIGAVIDAAVAAGAANVGGMSFEVEDDQKIRKEAAQKAVEDARSSAEVLARAAGAKLKRLLSIRYLPSPPLPLQRVEMMAAEARTPILTGEVPVRAEVQVVYEIE